MPIVAQLVTIEESVARLSCFHWFDLEIENEFKLKLQQYVAQLDAEKAALLAQLEKELNLRQELILDNARKRIDDLNEEANRLKMVTVTDLDAFSVQFVFFSMAF